MPKIKQDSAEQDKQVVHESQVIVRRQFTAHGRVVDEDESAETIAIHKFVTQPAEVGVQFGGTFNLGNFNGARVDIWCKVPTYKEEADEAYEFVKQFVDKRMLEEANGINQTNKKSKSDDNPF
jgi:hypothetical protein